MPAAPAHASQQPPAATPAEQRLLLVHAHPDDETIGQGATMAQYAAQGRSVTLVTCTAGEMGEILVPELEHLAADKEDRLGEHRRGEIADAMAALGVTDHRWLGGFGHYRDSGMQWHADGHAVAADDVHDNAFSRADLTEAATLLVEVIREVRPQVLVTYDEFGGYGHPDHIQAHRVAMYAAQLAAVPSYRPDLGAAWDIAKVYWGAMSESRMRAGLRALRDAGDTTSFEGMDPDGPLPHFVTADDDLSCAVDAQDHVERKMDALRAYPTQVTLDGPFFALSNNVGAAAWGVEFYRLVKGALGPVGDDGLESDLFAGLAGDAG
ncbi:MULTISPECIES: N-acetyl-1-D-myo-inositol-2-amino-2-deoxy-alpha-D-glucopyranoside deacetylase [Nocardioides]|uniref:N-acetyl-1-D-myo-inositol-2-amino-2-deoxy-alpha- D-glucopyranoside deacetylase n=2 Tax=Nocardioidaceae TaxID=85015 RepID=UPI0007023E5C|nr:MULTISPECIES: N-acetyl-1-D-myo-inositol-2-amino-2-deoxy-alpha-D-glucopyranoside deacetylase [Nocardioides]KQP66511.1 N-acetyl-1-D-myo-inositol-2-amino-2-deoxy-alpha-D-glucopyranoside deacetylase [Nocardioides sp. Leaf285]MCM3514349.1 N-acetyl-1-D-myo-inositol-2-amino-2-deoxy-alpha-D-glucopyranoside deacetylase [Nocardioides sp. P86]